MIKIGVMRGREDSFPNALVESINGLGRDDLKAEFVMLGGTKLNEPCPYQVIVDRIGHEVPYYQVYLKNAVLQGCYVINNPFWKSADDKFFGYAVAEKLGIRQPKTVVLPNVAYVEDINDQSLRNLWPIDFDAAAAFVGLPAILKPAFGGGWKSVHQVHTVDELRERYYESGQLTMLLQEMIVWDDYIRCFALGQKYARAIQYIPRPLLMGEYVQDLGALEPELRARAEASALQLNRVLGYDMNAVEFAVKNGELIGIDLTNHTPDMDRVSLREAHFPWVVETMTKVVIEKATQGPAPPQSWDRFLHYPRGAA